DSIAAIFGQDIISDNQLDRMKLANIVFNDKQELARLNALIHPQVQHLFDQWIIGHADEAIVIQEAAILIETGSYKTFDKIILVTANENTRLNRVVKRDSSTEEAVLSRMNNQMAEDEKLKFADYIINNNSDQLLMPQLLIIFKKLKE
ncbi:MAG: dephospho-CoA kinase, partial [Bacteroidales bacterium]|nr:dephospho-CoA kinase [Bacteroidales bacterium]